MSKYAQFDAMLLSLIESGCDTLTQLQGNKPLMAATKPFCVPTTAPYAPEPYRIIDRRLQALRKTGRIEYVRGKWHPKEGDE